VRISLGSFFLEESSSAESRNEHQFQASVIHVLFDPSGAVRDERLNRMWTLKKVKFVRPSEDQGRENFFNIFVLHQVFQFLLYGCTSVYCSFRYCSADCT
jgi:hypothetical protein